jgi:hypothetical protein
MSLQDKLEQARQDKKLAISTFDKEIQAIKTEIADSEVTFSIGSRFRNGEREYLLVHVGFVTLVDLKSGSWWSSDEGVSSTTAISESEFNRITGRTKGTFVLI